MFIITRRIPDQPANPDVTSLDTLREVLSRITDADPSGLNDICRTLLDGYQIFLEEEPSETRPYLTVPVEEAEKVCQTSNVDFRKTEGTYDGYGETISELLDDNFLN